MRICVVGDHEGQPDEAMKKVTYHMVAGLSKRHQVLRLQARSALSLSCRRKVREFCPEIIHYVHGPTIKSFIAVKALKAHWRHAKTVMSSLHPQLSSLSRRLVPMLKPDLMLTLAADDEALFKRLGCVTKFVPLGVDTDKFAPVTSETKTALRSQYGLNTTGPIVLHVGSIKQRRNLNVFKAIQQAGWQVLIVGAVSTGIEKSMQQELEAEGCIVWAKYVDKIEDLYALSDCYVFPVRDRIASIALPLSVMEAMSCNLPVISTRFGALPRLFEEENGFFFAEDEEDICAKLNLIHGMTASTATRDKVITLTWENVAGQLERVYEQLLGGAHSDEATAMGANKRDGAEGG